MTTSESGGASSSTQPPPTRKQLTNTNTDLQCYDEKSDGFLKRWLYRFNLWTGLYMLNPYERATFHIVGWISTIAVLLYGGVFCGGFVEGLRAAAATEAASQQ